MSDLRALIRELLVQEIAALGGKAGSSLTSGHAVPPVREEAVAIHNDADLSNFVSRVLAIADDPGLRGDLAAGRYRFRLSDTGKGQPQAHQPAAPIQQAQPARVRFDRGLITEKDVARLPDGASGISIGKTVRFTPLARDELRRRAIKIERTQS